MLAIAGGMRDLLTLGASVVELGLGWAGRRREGGPFASIFDTLLQAATPAGAVAGSATGTTEDGIGPSDHVKPADMRPLMTQACLAGAASGVRYWRRIAETCASHQAGILKSLSANGIDSQLSEHERRELADDIRAYFRELGDVSAQEARAFQMQLERLAQAVADSTPGSEQPAQQWRRWKTIP